MVHGYMVSQVYEPVIWFHNVEFHNVEIHDP